MDNGEEKREGLPIDFSKTKPMDLEDENRLRENLKKFKLKVVNKFRIDFIVLLQNNIANYTGIFIEKDDLWDVLQVILLSCADIASDSYTKSIIFSGLGKFENIISRRTGKIKFRFVAAPRLNEAINESEPVFNLLKLVEDEKVKRKKMKQIRNLEGGVEKLDTLDLDDSVELDSLMEEDDF